MDATPEKALTVGDMLPWLGMTLDYTEKIAELIPEDKLDWRPEDPSGKFNFSLAELAMHCADARRMFARQLAGHDSNEGFWSKGPEEEAEESGVWEFKECGSKDELLKSLKEARAELAEWYGKPQDELLTITEGSRESHLKALKWMEEHDQDPAEHARRGPASIMRVLMATAVHEAGHRGTLQTLLRQQGINVKHPWM